MTTEVRQRHLLKWIKVGFGTVTKAIGIEVLTPIYFVSLTVLEKAVPIQTVLFPQKVCTSKGGETYHPHQNGRRSKQGLLCLSWEKLLRFRRIACLKTLQNSAHGFMALHWNICFQIILTSSPAYLTLFQWYLSFLAHK